MITVDDWAEVRRLHRSEHLPIKAIARKLGISKNTVKRALRAQEVPQYQRAARGSIVDPAEPAIREQLRLCPTMPATVIAERIGWEWSITVLRDRVGQLRQDRLANVSRFQVRRTVAGLVHRDPVRRRAARRIPWGRGLSAGGPRGRRQRVRRRDHPP